MKKERFLTEAEKKRLENFEKIAEDMQQQGYQRHDLTVNITAANIFAIVLLIPLFVIGYGTYYLVYRQLEFTGFNPLIFIIVFIILIVIHELIHGLTWSLFTPRRFRDIEFGITKPSMNPYCTCLVPLEKNHYLLGTAMPLIILGILPMIAGIVLRNPLVLFYGIIMADGAAGDIMIIYNLLRYHSSGSEIIYMDHPTEAGGVVFER